MELQNFEKSMHQKFQDFKPEVNELKIWDGIESKIPQKKKRRAIFWICWIGLPFILLSILTYLKISDYPFASIDNQKIEKQTVQKSSTDKQAIEAIQKEGLNEQKFELDESAKPTNNVIEDEPKAVTKEAKTNNISSTVAHDLTSNNSENFSQNNPSVNVAQTQFAGSGNTRNFGELKAHPNEGGVNEQSQASLHGKKHSSTQLVYEPRTQGLMLTELLPSIVQGINYSNVQTDLNPVWDTQLFQREKQEKFKAFHAVGLQLGYAKMFSNYQSVDTPLLNLRSRSETPLDQVSLGLIYKYQISKRFSLQSGLNFWQANWQSIHTTESREVLSINFQQITRTKEISYIKYGKDRALSFPILMEYDFIKKEKFSGSFGLGYEFNLLGTHKGFEIDINGQEYNIEDDVESRYLNKSGNYLMMQLGAGYNLNEHTLLQINMAYKYGLNAFQTQASSVQKSYRFLGLNAGILKRIN